MKHRVMHRTSVVYLGYHFTNIFSYVKTEILLLLLYYYYYY